MLETRSLLLRDGCFIWFCHCAFSVAVGTALASGPRTDPYVRNYLIRLLPRVHLTASRSLEYGCSTNRVRLSLLGACRTRHKPCDSLPRLCVRYECARGAFPLVALLPSADSATNTYASALFARFAGTMRPSDSLQTCMPTLRLLAFFDRPTLPSSAGVCRASRFSRMELPHMPRVSGREKKSPEPHSGSILGEQLNPEQESEQRHE